MNHHSSPAKSGGVLNWLRTSIRAQLGASFAGLAMGAVLIVVLVLTIFSVNQVREALTDRVFDELEAVRTLKAIEMRRWIEERKSDIRFIRELTSIQGNTEGNQGLGVLAEYKDTPSDAAYRQAYLNAERELRAFITQHGQNVYQDALLIDTDGEIVFALDQALREINEAEQEIFQNALTSVYFGDLFYNPTDEALDLRIGAPVRDPQGVTVGVIILELNPQQLNELMVERTGLGETGETYLIGQDNLFRNEARFLDALGVETTVLNENVVVDTVAVLSAFDGQSRTARIEDYRGQIVLSSWTPITVQPATLTDPEGIQWALIVEIDEGEALASINALAQFIVGMSAVLILLAGALAIGLGTFLANRLINPIVSLTESATKIAAGDLAAEVPTVDRDDEVGSLARAFSQMTDNLQNSIHSLRQRGEELESRDQELRTRTEQLEANQRAVRVVFAASEQSDPGELLRLTVNLIRDRFDMYHVQIYIVEEEKNAAVLRESTGYAGLQLLQKDHQIPLDQSALVTQAIHEGEPVVVNDVNQNPDFLANPLLPDTQSEMVVPLKIEDRVIGAVDIQSRDTNTFTSDVVGLFETMTDQIALLFQNSELYLRTMEQTEELTHFTTQLRTAATVSERLSTILDPEELLNEVVELLQSRFGFYHAHIYMLDENNERLVVRAGSGEVGEVLRQREHSISTESPQSLVARAARERQVVVVNDTAIESGFLPNPLLPQTRAEAAVPLITGGKLLGVLDVQDDQPERFAESDMATFNTLAGQIATALDNARLFEEQQRLTAILNNSNDFIALTDLQGGITYINPGGMDMLGYEDLEEVMSKVIPDFHTPEDTARVLEEGIPVAMTEGTWRGENRLKHRNGHLISVDQTIFVIRDDDGQPQSLATIMIDITDRLEAERRIREINERFTLAKESINLGVWDWDVQNDELTWDDTMYKLYGIQKEEFSGAYEAWTSGMHPDDAEASAAALQAALEGKGEFDVEFRVVQPSGKIRHIKGDAVIIRADDGAPLRAVGMNYDITDQKKAEQELIQRATELQTVAEVSTSATTTLDPDKLLQDVVDLTKENFSLYHAHIYLIDDAGETLELAAGAGEAGQQMVAQGWSIPADSETSLVARAYRSREGVIANDVQAAPDFLPNPLLPDTASELAVPLIAGEKVLGVLDVQSAQVGHFTPQDVNIQTTLAGQVAAALDNARLFEEQVRAEAAIKDLARRNQLVLDSAAEGIYGVDQNGRTVFVNPAAVEMLGFSEDELIGGMHHHLIHHHRADGSEYPAEECKVYAAYRDGTTHAGEDEIYWHKDGHSFPVSYTSTPIKDDDGNILGAVVTFRDITDELAAREATEKRAAELQTVAEVGTAAAASLDPQELLLQVSELTKERFDLYHAHIYLIDDAGETLELAAGAGEAGQEMVAQGWSIPADSETSLVARAYRSREGVIANDVQAAPDFLPNPLLPDTASELAVPLIAGDDVLGVLDVQSAQVGRFTDADVAIQTTLAGQIATALENARLFEEQRRLTALLNNSDDYIALANPQGEIIYVNPGGAKMVGYDAPREIIGMNITDSHTPEDTARVLEKGVPVAMTEGTWRSENRLKHCDGHLIPVDQTIFVIRDDEGEVETLATIMIDITEQKEAEQQLRQRAAELQTVAEVGTAAAASLDPQELLLQVSELTKERFDLYHAHIYLIDDAGETLELAAGAGEAGQQMVAQGWSIDPDSETSLVARAYRSREGVIANDVQAAPDFLPNPLLPDTASELAVPLIAGDDVLGVLDVQSAQVGRFTDADVAIQTTLAGQIATALDNARLFEEQLRLTAIVSTSRDMIALTSMEGVITYINPEGARLAGYDKPEEAIGKVIADFHTPEDLQRVSEQGIPVAMQEGSWRGENRIRRTDGTLIPVEQTIFVIRDDNGAPRNLATIISDITERKEAEIALRSSRERLSEALDIAQLVPWEFDIARGVFIFNDSFYASLGTTAEQEGGYEMSAETYAQKYVHPDETAVVSENVGKAIQTTDPNYTTEIDTRVVRADGEVRNVLVRLRIEKDAQGNTVKLIGANQDITERKEVEEEIRRLALVAQETLNAVIITNAEKQIEWVNPGFTRLTEYTLDEVRGKKPGDFLQGPETDQATVQRLREAIGKRESITEELINYSKSGHKYWLEINLQPIFGESGEVEKFIAIESDVTERRHTQEEIRKRATELQTVAEVSTSASSTLDTEKLLQEVVNLTKERFNLYHAHIYLIDDKGTALKLAAGAGEAGQKMLAQSWSINAHSETSLVARAFRTREGVIENDVQAAPDFLPNPLLPDTASELAVPLIVSDRVLGVLDVQSDVVDRFTEQDVAIKTTLARQVATALDNARLFQEAQQVADRLREVDRMKSEFLANMSHELRTPLNSILGYTQLLLLDLEETLPQESLEDMQSIHLNGQHLLSMINDILDLAKIEAGRLNLNFEELEIGTLLESVQASNSGLFLEKPIEMVIEMEEDIPPVWADSVRMTQVLNNLVANAVKFTDEGQITIRTYHQDDGVKIEVADEGIGIDDEDMDKLFERFRQIDGSYTRRAEGTGLGLPITRHLVEMHGGVITVESEIGVGSTFTIHLPNIEEAQAYIAEHVDQFIEA